MLLKKNKGFSIVEVIVAMIIMSITVISSFEFYRFCMKNFIMDARYHMMGSDFARGAMEQKYFLNTKDFDALGSTGLPVSVALPIGSELKDTRSGTMSYTITQETGYKTIETKVIWT
jgi:prepilin-type N-terminal cleavage/methylation domain